MNFRQQSGRRGISAQFVGAWGLISFEHVQPSGEVLKPFGDSPSGLILYQADGHMSAQISAGPSKRFAREDPLEASIEEVSDAWRMYLGYWGTFEANAESGVVIHRVAGSSFPNWFGTEQVRYFRFDGNNRLILEAESSAGRSILLWQRISS